ncbi:MAG: peptidylprolyl isomerase [Chitinophagaceae bacterium]|nr:peptidylprolyl isomerase [Chitinophagaceae bacterium]
MKQVLIIIVSLISFSGSAQKKTISQIKQEIEKSTNSPLYVKDILKKKFKIDTVAIMRTSSFNGIYDSLGYHGKVGKVYGPYAKGKVLMQVLAKAPGPFNRVGQIFLDTTIFSKRFADSLATNIIHKVQSGQTSFEEMAQIYSMGGEGITKGDLGWIAVGALLAPLEKELAKRKKGEIFKVWTANGLHIVRKTENTKQDHGFALIMRVFL